MASPETLFEATLASSAAIVLVLLLRRTLRKAFGARVAYGAWALVPAALVAVLLPAVDHAPMANAMFPMQYPMPILPAQAAVAGGVDPALLLAVCWIAGIFVSLGWMAMQQRRFRRGLGRLAARADCVCEAEHDVDGLPATVGLFPPRIVVPPGFDRRFDPRQRELMLAHERAHLRRGDVPANALAAALRCLFWFNPLLHLAMPRFRQDQELACDATVLAGYHDVRRHYGEALLQVQLAAQASPLGCHFGFGHPLRERIAMLKEPTPSIPRRVLGTALVASLGIAFAFAAWATQPPQAAAGPIAGVDMSDPSLTPPRYPAYAFEHNLAGRVLLLVDVDAHGNVTHAVVERAEPEGVFEETSLEAVKQWKFTPAMKDGKPVASRVRVPIDFALDPPDDAAAPVGGARTE